MRPSDAEIRDLYVNQSLTDAQIAAHYGVSDVTVSNWRKHYKIPKREIVSKLKKSAAYDISELTEDRLRRHYYEDKLSAEQIGLQYGVYKSTVLELMTQYGLSRLRKRDRNAPQSTFPQDMVLGTLLGDASIGFEEKGDASRYSLSHSTKQYMYLKSIHAKFGDWVSPVASRSGTSKFGQKHTSYGFSTKYHPEFRTLRKRFYRDDLRGTIPVSWLKAPPLEVFSSLSDESLAYWYFDDGSFDVNVRIVVFFPLLNIHAVCQALVQGTGLKWEVRQYDSSQEHLYFLMLPVSEHAAFFERVFPYATTDLAYKFPVGFQSRFTVPMEIPPLLGECSAERLEMYPAGIWRTLPKLTQDRWVQEVFEIYRNIGFPFPKRLSPEDASRTVRTLCAHQEVIEDGGVFNRAMVGLSLCNGFMPHRFEAETRGGSAWATFNDDKAFKEVILTQFKCKGSKWVTPSAIRGALAIYGGNRTPANFRPSITKSIVDKLCVNNGTVWDPCAGFGGRLLGVLCSHRQPKYIGTEPSPQTVAGLRALAFEVCSVQHWNPERCKILQGVAELDCPEPNSCDLVLTSPPYFRAEKYVGGAQSYLTYKTYEQWTTGFLTPLVTNSFSSLKEGGYMVINIQDVMIRGRMRPLVQDLDRIARTCGFIRHQRYWYPLNRIGKARSDEPILVYVKPVQGQVYPTPEWDLDSKHISVFSNSSKENTPMCIDCGTDLAGANREGRRCRTCKLANDALRAKEARSNRRTASQT